MEKASTNMMELGNLLFGNSRGTYAMPREEYQDMFRKFLEDNGFDGYGYKDGSNSSTFDNPVFTVRPYYWGSDDAIASLPNFVYKPKRIEISWYKYPLRDAYCSHDVPLDEFEAMLADCAASMATRK